MRLDADAVERSVCQVTSAETGDRTFGTCFAIGRRGKVVRFATCAHVVRDIGVDRLQVAGVPARVGAMGDADGPDDVALLDADVPDARPLALGARARPGDECVVWGFTAVLDNPYTSANLAALDEFRPIAGRVVTSVRLAAGGRRAVPAWRIETEEDLVAGLSGSPVISTVTTEVVGIASIARTGTRVGIALGAPALAPFWAALGRLFGPHDVRGIPFVPIPAGEFAMGTEERLVEALAAVDVAGSPADEAPRHQVTTRSYHLSRFPVTNRQYAAYVEECGGPVPYRADGLSAPFSWDPVTRRPPAGADDHPVVLVSWHDARGFCRWLGGRLPTEPEWERAARSDEDREWPWGDEWDQGRCNTAEGGRGRILPVGSFSPAGDSGFGVADMSGNVWEWCQSAFAPYPHLPVDGRDGLGALGPRALRGGAFGEDRYRARCAARNRTSADDAGFTIGFRVALPLDSPSLLPSEP